MRRTAKDHHELGAGNGGRTAGFPRSRPDGNKPDRFMYVGECGWRIYRAVKGEGREGTSTLLGRDDQCQDVVHAMAKNLGST